MEFLGRNAPAPAALAEGSNDMLMLAFIANVAATTRKIFKNVIMVVSCVVLFRLVPAYFCNDVGRFLID